MKPNTAQQVNTLLYYLQTKQTPPFKILFWENLQKIDLIIQPTAYNNLVGFCSNGKTPHSIATIIGKTKAGKHL